MVELNPGAAYILKSPTRDAPSGTQHSLTDIDLEVLQLLRSAHTARSVSLTMSRDRGGEITSLEPEVRSSMARLLQYGLIELSPDS